MLKQKLTTPKHHLCIYGAIAIFYFWMAAQIPYTHDDWDWGLDIGLHQLLYATVNSRYVGNFFEVVMTRSELLKTIIMGTSYFLIPFLLSWIATQPSNRNKHVRLFYFLLCNLLLLTINRNIWRQTYGWIAGFANFGISVVFMIPWLYEIFHLFDDKSANRNVSFSHLIFLFLTSVASQLFLENLAIFNVFLGIFLCCVRYSQQRRIDLKYLFMLMGAVVGIIIMFSSSLYETLLDSGSAINEYRQIPLLQKANLFSAILLMLRSTASLLSQLYASNIVICIAIVLTLIYLLGKKKAEIRESSYKIARFVNYFILVVFVLCVVSTFFLKHFMAEKSSTYIKLMYLPVSILFLVTVTADLCLLFRQNTRSLCHILTIWFAAPMLISPLVVTTETGYRLFLSTNILLILFLLCLLNQCIISISSSGIEKLNRITAILLFACIVFHCAIYAQIGNCKKNREQIIQSALQDGSSEISLPAYPFSEYLHWPNPIELWRVDCFKEFYGIPMEVEIIFED